MKPETPPLRLEWRTASELQDNPANWRKHPQQQLAALRAVIDDPEIGWAGVCLFNERTGRLIDGHARKSVSGDRPVPVVIGNWSEEAERKILATLDPLVALAEADPEKLSALLDGFAPADEALNKLVAELRTTVAAPTVEFKEFDESVADGLKKVTCPKCGCEFPTA